MERLADELYKRIRQELGLSSSCDACIVGCVKAFTEKPEIRVTYIIRGKEGGVLGGSLDAKFKRGILGGYTVDVLQNISTSLHLSEEELKKVGLRDANMDRPSSSKTQRLMDDHQPWLLRHLKGAKSFAENIAPEFEKLVKELVETKAGTH